MDMGSQIRTGGKPCTSVDLAEASARSLSRAVNGVKRRRLRGVTAPISLLPHVRVPPFPPEDVILPMQIWARKAAAFGFGCRDEIYKNRARASRSGAIDPSPGDDDGMRGGLNT